MVDSQVEVCGGVDTHRDTHVVAVVDTAGRVLGTAPFPADRVGYEQMTRWLRTHGQLLRVGVEGTGSYGAGLARYLTEAGIAVVEVNRPNRQLRRQRGGKSDSIDAEAAARAAASGQATAVPKSGVGPVECIRMLLVARRSAVKARTQAANQIHALVITAPEHLNASSEASRSRPGSGSVPDGVPVGTRPRPRMRRWLCATSPADTRPSMQKSRNSTLRSVASAPRRTLLS